MTSVGCGHMPRQSNKEFFCAKSYHHPGKSEIITLKIAFQANLYCIRRYQWIAGQLYLHHRVSLVKTLLKIPMRPEWTNFATWPPSQSRSPYYHELYYMRGNTAKKGCATRMLPIFRKFPLHHSLIRKTPRARTWNDSRMYDERNKRHFLVLSMPLHIVCNCQICH